MLKLILANNQTERFVNFYEELKTQSSVPFDYSGYNDLLFVFDTEASQTIDVYNIASQKKLTDYDGVYINGYLPAYEYAATVAICCTALGVGFQNREMADAPSLSKLSAYAKLAANGVSIPKTIAGSKAALLQAESLGLSAGFPAILKRADADRGIDNYKVKDYEEVKQLLNDHNESSIWVLQEFVPNDGYYLLTYYNGVPEYAIFRTLEKRPDGNEQKAHMYKPKGGVNASLIDISEVNTTIVDECTRAITVINRQIGSVDCIYDADKGRAYILEVNYNPQFVTIETFKEARTEAFLNNLKHLQ